MTKQFVAKHLRDFEDLRFPVQWVNRPNPDFRGFSGTLAAGILNKGDSVMALPSRKTSRVKAIVTYDGELDEAFPPQAITITLEDEVDVSRGDLLVRPNGDPMLDSRFNAHLVWMAESPLIPGRPYLFKQATRTVGGAVDHLYHRIDINTLETASAAQLHLNEIGLCEVALSAPVAWDPYRAVKGTGSFILIDRLTNGTVAAGMILGTAERPSRWRRVTAGERALRFGQRALTLWITGANRRQAAYDLERRLFDRGHVSAVLDEPSSTADAVASSLTRAGLVCIRPTGENPPPPPEADRLILDAAALDLECIVTALRPPAEAEGVEPNYQI